MGVHICFCDKQNENIIKDSSIDCYKKTEQCLFGNIITANNINNTSSKKSLNNNEDNNLSKMKCKKIINDNININYSKTRNSTIKTQNYIKNVIKIQRCFRKYLNAIRIRNDYENIIIEDNASLKMNFGETVFSTISYHNSNISPDKNSQNNKTSEVDSNIIYPFNIKNKLKIMKYKYTGYIKRTKHKKSTKSSSDEKDNNEIEEKLGVIKEGFGKFTFLDGTEFCGIFHDNILQKYGKYSNLNQGNNKNVMDKEIIFSNNLNYEEVIGEYKNYIPDGFGIYKNYISNLKLKGIFQGNSMSGIGIENSVEGGYTYQGDFINNKKEGIGTMKWKDGYVYQGEFKDNQINGYGIIQYPGDKYYHGEVKNGKMEGFGHFFWKNEKIYIGYYKNDKRNGFGIFIDKLNHPHNSLPINDIDNNFSAFIGFWKNGNMDGFGMKVNKMELKYGIWENGMKKKILDSTFALKTYVKWMNKSYSNLFLSQQNDIINF